MLIQQVTFIEFEKLGVFSNLYNHFICLHGKDSESTNFQRNIKKDQQSGPNLFEFKLSSEKISCNARKIRRHWGRVLYFTLPEVGRSFGLYSLKSSDKAHGGTEN